MNKTPEKEWPGRRGKPGGASVPETDGGERFPEPCSGVSNALREFGKDEKTECSFALMGRRSPVTLVGATCGKSGAEVRIQGTDAKTRDGGELARGARGEGTEGDD